MTVRDMYVSPLVILASFTLGGRRLAGLLGLVWVALYVREWEPPDLATSKIVVAVVLPAAGFGLLTLRPQTAPKAWQARILWLVPAAAMALGNMAPLWSRPVAVVHVPVDRHPRSGRHGACVSPGGAGIRGRYDARVVGAAPLDLRWRVDLDDRASGLHARFVRAGRCRTPCGDTWRQLTHRAASPGLQSARRRTGGGGSQVARGNTDAGVGVSAAGAPSQQDLARA